MSVRPLPGASYHTIGSFHSFDPSDLEAAVVDDSTSGDGLSERKDLDPFRVDEHKYLVDPRPTYSSCKKRRCRRPPVLLSIIVLICLAFVASAFWGNNSSGRPNVPDRHTPLPIHLSSASRTKTSFETLVDEHFNGALEMMEQTFECAHRGCSEDVDLRRHLLQNFPLVNPSVQHTLIGNSAIVLHWQGTDSSLKPVLVTNTDAVLDVGTRPKHVQGSATLPCGDNGTKHLREFADVESGVGILIAADALLRSGYQPSRTLVFSLILGDASDTLKVSEYLHDTYGELGLNMEFNPPKPECRNKGFRVLNVFHATIGRVFRALGALLFTPSLNVRPTPDAPRLFRYTFNPAIDRASLTKLRIQTTEAWVRLVIDADRN